MSDRFYMDVEKGEIVLFGQVLTEEEVTFLVNLESYLKFFQDAQKKKAAEEREAAGWAKLCAALPEERYARERGPARDMGSPWWPEGHTLWRWDPVTGDGARVELGGEKPVVFFDFREAPSFSQRRRARHHGGRGVHMVNKSLGPPCAFGRRGLRCYCGAEVMPSPNGGWDPPEDMPLCAASRRALAALEGEDDVEG